MMSIGGAASFVTLPLAGLWSRRFPIVREAPVRAQLAAATAVGALTIGTTLLCCAALHISWSWPVLAAPTIAGVALGSRQPRTRRTHENGRRAAPLTVLGGYGLAVVSLAVLTYALLTARATSIDYLYFWGTKGFRFASVRTIDTAFLARPDHMLMHSDYPPLLPIVYAYLTMTGGMSWWTGLWASSIFAVAAAVWFGGGSRGALSAVLRAATTGVIAGTLAIGLIVPYSGGNAEALLLLFVIVALGTLTLSPPSPPSDWLVGICLAGATLTKMEGMVFAGLVSVVYGFERRVKDRRTVLRLATPPAAALMLWLAFAMRNHILAVYRHPFPGLTLNRFGSIAGEMLRSASYGAGYLPWIAGLILWLLGGNKKLGVSPLVVGLGYVGFALFTYLHGGQYPPGATGVSAPRVLLTSVTCFFFAGVASLKRETASPEAVARESPRALRECETV